ncbi:MAG: hypothetical protein AAB727_02935 [Patescibacteria group bacterium]
MGHLNANEREPIRFSKEVIDDSVAKIEIQRSIIRRDKESAAPHAGSDLDWVENYAGRFRDIVEKHPEFVEEWKRTPDGVIQKIENELYRTIH